MKNFLLAALLLLGLSSVASAQNNTVKVNVFSPLVRTGSFFYEHKVSEHNSVQLGGLFTAWSVGDTKISGFALTPEYRFYLSDSKPALEGFYFAPFARYQNLTLTVTDAYLDLDGSVSDGKASLNTFGGGVLAGYQLMFKRRFTLDAFFGPSYNGGSLKITAGNTSQSFDAGSFQGFGLRTGITFGVAF
jgi:opacity protein-like surface antigen